MKLTSKGELALKAMIELAKAENDASGGLSAAEIARRCKASVKFLEQVMTSLRSAGYVLSSRGRLGGYRLARGADEIVVGEISRLIDGPLAPAPCASLTRHQACDWCESEDDCDLKTVWVQVREATARVMDSISLAELARDAAERHAADRYVI
ncbi:MAG TPA: Rrf2 family transcriptional regulator [Dehalococcoidia bacterium]|nr:Rrf2 family transcriptional regulator [Dehalococcoidia bacterium]